MLSIVFMYVKKNGFHTKKSQMENDTTRYNHHLHDVMKIVRTKVARTEDSRVPQRENQPAESTEQN